MSKDEGRHWDGGGRANWTEALTSSALTGESIARPSRDHQMVLHCSTVDVQPCKKSMLVGEAVIERCLEMAWSGVESETETEQERC